LLAAVLGVLALATPGRTFARGRGALGGRVVGDVVSLERRDIAASIALSLAAEAGDRQTRRLARGVPRIRPRSGAVTAVSRCPAQRRADGD